MSELHPFSGLGGLGADHAGLEILSVDECHRLLAAAPVARLAFVDHGAPVILPVTITPWGGSVVFATDRGSKLEAAVMERPVALEVDEWDATAQSGWSVLVKGTAMTVDDAAELADLDSRAATAWVRPGQPKRWVRVLPNEITGRRIVAEVAG